MLLLSRVRREMSPVDPLELTLCQMTPCDVYIGGARLASGVVPVSLLRSYVIQCGSLPMAGSATYVAIVARSALAQYVPDPLAVAIDVLLYLQVEYLRYRHL